MTASAPQIPKIITFTLGASSFAEDVIDAAVEPTLADGQKVTTLDGVVHQDVGTESWDLVLKTVLDWDSGRPGLAYYLWTNKGTAVAFVLNVHGTGAESASQPKMTGTCKLVPIGYGGAGNAYAEVEVRLPIVGVPVRDATP